MPVNCFMDISVSPITRTDIRKKKQVIPMPVNKSDIRMTIEHPIGHRRYFCTGNRFFRLKTVSRIIG